MAEVQMKAQLPSGSPCMGMPLTKMVTAWVWRQDWAMGAKAEGDGWEDSRLPFRNSCPREWASGHMER